MSKIGGRRDFETHRTPRNLCCSEDGSAEYNWCSEGVNMRVASLVNPPRLTPNSSNRANRRISQPMPRTGIWGEYPLCPLPLLLFNLEITRRG